MFSDPAVTFWFALILRMLIIAIVVVGASVLVEKSKPFIGALVASLPIAAAAAYIILALERDAAFVAQTALGSIVGFALTGPFALTYGLLAQQRGFAVSLGGALLVWLFGAVTTSTVHWTIVSAILFNVVVLSVSIVLSFRYCAPVSPGTRVVVRRSDVAARAITVALFVGAITFFSQSIGSYTAGLFAVFPAVMSSFIIIMHHRIGGRATARILAQLQISSFGLSLGFLPVHFGAERIGVWLALGAGLATGLVWTALLLTIQQRVRRRRAVAHE